jgi:hypothetical protein
MATLKYYAQKDAYGFPIPGTMMGIAAHLPVPVGTFEIPAANHIPTPARKGQGSGLRYFVRHDKKGNIIPNSLVATLKKPTGLVYEFQVPGDGINDIPTGGGTNGITVKISHDAMSDPVCSTTTTLLVQITSGTSISDALTITGDFASLGVYYTPADPNNPMAQPPRFDIAYLVNGVLKNRYFTLTGVGVASGFDPMFGTSQENTCL